MRCARARWRCAGAYPGGPTAVLTHGANPGLVSHFVKQALVDLARDAGLAAGAPQSRARLGAPRRAARRQGHPHRRARHAGRRRSRKQPGEFVNTWSIDGFVSEGSQPAELGWGTHERHFPRDGRRHDFGSGAAIYLLRPGAATRVRSWTPLEGPYHGFLITHGEVDLDRRLPDRAEDGDGPRTGRPATTPITPATTRCCPCTSWPARTGGCRSASG